MQLVQALQLQHLLEPNSAHAMFLRALVAEGCCATSDLPLVIAVAASLFVASPAASLPAVPSNAYLLLQQTASDRTLLRCVCCCCS
jgi:hypothetical protein